MSVSQLFVNQGFYYLHSVPEHSGETERNLLRQDLPFERDLKTISKVDMDDFARQVVKHDIAGVSVSDAKDITYHITNGK